MKRRDFLGLMGASGAVVALPQLSFAKNEVPAVPLVIPSELADNPLLNFGNLPDYTAITPAHLEQAVPFIHDWGKQAIIALCQQKTPTWDNFYRPLEDIHAKLEYSNYIARNINSVLSTKEFRAAYDTARKARSAFTAWYENDEGVYKQLTALKNSKAYKNYAPLQKSALKKDLWEFEKSGVGLPANKKERLAKINEALGELRNQFANNVQDSIKWSKTITDVNLLKGISDADLAMAKKNAEKAGETGYRFDLSDSSFWAIIENAENRELRQAFHRANATRASELSEQKQFDNLPIIKKILALRHEMATILGYKNFAEYALIDRMAKNPKEVMDFYKGLTPKVKAKAQKQLDELTAYGKKIGIDDPQAWDFAYIANKQRIEKYELDDEILRPYFPIDRVLNGMFEVYSKLFGIVVKERKDVKVWHESVRFFEIFDERGELLGSAYADLYEREHKKGGAWKSNFINRRRDLNGNMVSPVAVLVTNIAPPDERGTALLMHEDVVTLFHEFGHIVHHIIGEGIEFATIAGTSGVPRDAVEFPSQLMEYWVWDKNVIPYFSGHYQTGEPLPQNLVEQTATAKNYLLAKNTLRQIELGLTDIRLYNEYDPKDPNCVEKIIADVKQAVQLSDTPAYARTINIFGHIFSGGYGAGYYGYIWSDVLSADVHSHFTKVGVFNRAEGQRYVDKFLGKGGSEEVMKMYVDFMGRKPSPTAFTEQLGI